MFATTGEYPTARRVGEGSRLPVHPTGDSPTTRRVGKVSRLPVPTTALTTPATRPAARIARTPNKVKAHEVNPARTPLPPGPASQAEPTSPLSWGGIGP